MRLNLHVARNYLKVLAAASMLPGRVISLFEVQGGFVCYVTSGLIAALIKHRGKPKGPNAEHRYSNQKSNVAGNSKRGRGTKHNNA